MTAKEIPATVRSERVIQYRRIGRRDGTQPARIPATRLEAVDDADLKRTTWRSIVAFQRLFGHHGPDARLLEHPDFVATAVPASNSSLINAAAPVDDASLAAHLDEIEAFYADIPKWGVWIDPAATADADALTTKGLVLDSTPVLMAATLDAVERRADTTVERVTMDELGAVNDAAYGIPPGTLATALAGFPPAEVRSYGIRDGSDVISGAVLYDVGDDAFVTFVATLPDHRGKQLASTTLSHALHEAEQRGQRTTSLQASRLGQSIYARLGYHSLGEIHLYEMRPE